MFSDCWRRKDILHFIIFDTFPLDITTQVKIENNYDGKSLQISDRKDLSHGGAGPLEWKEVGEFQV